MAQIPSLQPSRVPEAVAVRQETFSATRQDMADLVAALGLPELPDQAIRQPPLHRKVITVERLTAHHHLRCDALVVAVAAQVPLDQQV
jgi:hypothetical protein